MTERSSTVGAHFIVVKSKIVNELQKNELTHLFYKFQYKVEGDVNKRLPYMSTKEKSNQS